MIDSSTFIFPSSATVSDEDLIHVITTAHKLDMKVLLIPAVGLVNDPQHTRSSIGLHFTSLDWIHWFESYRLMLRHYAVLANQLHVESFSVGWELVISSSNAHS